MRIKLHPILVLLTLLVGFAIAPAGQAQSTWTWELSNERYQQLNMFERAQYDKAAKLIKDGNPIAAASEFEKFQTQFPNSQMVSYIAFMRGYSMHLAKTRGAAIKIYNEVMDYFGTQVADAAPALYFMGMANLDNGDTREGLKCMQEMIADEDYQKHPLAAGAYRQLGDNAWRNKEPTKAVPMWKKACDFWKTNAAEANTARDNVTAYYIKNRDYTGYESWLVSAKNTDDAAHRRWVAENAWNAAWNGFAGDWGKYTFANRQEKAEDMKAFWLYYKSRKEWYGKTDPWYFFDRSLHFLAYRWNEGKERDTLIEDALTFIKTVKEKQDQDNKIAWIIDRLRDAGIYDRAMYLADQMSDRPQAEYKKYEVYARQADWTKAEAKLKEIEVCPADYWKMRAQEERARVYKDVLGKYEEAIKLYQAINKPPGTVWAIQECYKRWGKLKEALGILTEIENSFPSEAPEAAWHKAAYFDEAGQGENAIAQARRILKVYPQSQASSRAHQLLEKYGIATGGGVADGQSP